MVRIIGIVMAATTALAPAAAHAADWWWVAGEPGSQEAWFVDTDTIEGNGAQLSFDLLHIEAGREAGDPEGRQVDCDRASPDPVQRFVCATPEQRLSMGAMLGPMAPDVAATAIFQAAPVETARR